jgi:hypothetical protein
METVELGGFSETKNDPIRLNFGGGGFDEPASLDTGIDLLMNHKGAASPKKVDFTSSSMDDLERELNSMVDGPEMGGSSGSSGSTTKLFGGISDWFSSSPKPTVGSTTLSGTDSKIGQATKESIGNAQTWDGFMKINDTHVANGVSSSSSASSSKNLSELEKRRKKRAMIKKLDEWRDKGLLKNASHYNMDSNYEEVEDEYETALEDKRKSESLKLQAWWLKTLVTTVEFGSSYIDFDLSGFGEQVEDDIHSYDEIFEELYEKYKGGKMHPVVSLLLKLGLTAATVNITNRALSTATPGFRDVIKQSPELMKMFTSATVDAMSQKSPGFSFANQMMDPPMSQAPPKAFSAPSSFGPPMEPVSQRSVRPDLQEARGNNGFGNGLGMSLRESDDFPQQQQQQQQKTNRPQMRGPSADIEQLFSGLKPSINQTSNNSETDSLAPIPGGDDSIVSIASLKELQNTQLPKSSSKRRNRSEKNLNVVSLDI